jgi:hypothetical protein
LVLGELLLSPFDPNRSAGAPWYLNRLKKMQLKEIPYRINQFLQKKIDKNLPADNFFNAIDVNFNGDVWENFQNQNSNTSRLNEICDETHTIIKEADLFTEHKFDIFGLKANFGKQINVHFDPKSGKTWPNKFWGDIDYRNAEIIGGIKFAWELNRLHHWPKLAIAYSLTGNLKYFDELFNQVRHWIEENSYPRGINWISGIEIGIRIVNLFYTLKYLRTEKLSRNQKELIQNFIYIHAQHLYRYPSKYSSCANHAIAEALGLIIAGLYFPSLKNSNNWKSFGKKVLEREVVRQIYPDGSSFEHTIHYLQFVVDHFLVYYLVCKENNENINANIEKRLKAACSFISSIVDINGNIPMIGDDDDGYLLKIWFGEHNNFFSILNSCSILFERPDWIHPRSLLDTKANLLLGSSARIIWEKLKNEQAWQRNFLYFENAGLAVIAHRKSGKEILFVGNSGPLGLEPMSGHGHADALSFWLSIDGKPFFVDTGTYLYHSGGKWRRYFRSTLAHNTVQIDDQDQAEQISDFMFGDFYRIHNINWSDRGDRIEWGAEHTGYKRLIDPVVHRREVTYLKRRHSFNITDLLKCSRKHNVKIIFHLHPDVEVVSKGENIFRLTSGNASVVLKVDQQLNGQVISGSKNPLMGWYSPRFNSLEKTKSLVFTKEISGDSVFKNEVVIL